MAMKALTYLQALVKVFILFYDRLFIILCALSTLFFLSSVAFLPHGSIF